MKFRDLTIGQVFEFSGQRKGLATGPWRKISARRYQCQRDSMIYQIGTINVDVDVCQCGDWDPPPPGHDWDPQWAHCPIHKYDH